VRKIHALHGRDHLPNGSDPIPATAIQPVSHYVGNTAVQPHFANVSKYPGGVRAIPLYAFDQQNSSLTDAVVGFSYKQMQITPSIQSFAAAPVWFSGTASELGLVDGLDYLFFFNWRTSGWVSGSPPLIGFSRNGVFEDEQSLPAANVPYYVVDRVSTSSAVAASDLFEFKVRFSGSGSGDVYVDTIWAFPASLLSSGEAGVLESFSWAGEDGPTATSTSDQGYDVVYDTQALDSLLDASLSISAWELSFSGNPHTPVQWVDDVKDVDDANYELRHTRYGYVAARYNGTSEGATGCHMTLFEASIPRSDVLVYSKSFGFYYMGPVQPKFTEFQLALWQNNDTGVNTVPFSGDNFGKGVSDVRAGVAAFPSSAYDDWLS